MRVCDELAEPHGPFGTTFDLPVLHHVVVVLGVVADSVHRSDGRCDDSLLAHVDVLSWVGLTVSGVCGVWV